MPCNERVGKGVITYPCTLPDNHPGPHTSNESSASQRERARWENDQAAQVRHAASGLAEFQGVAQTTAQRYTENATPVPVSAGRARLHNGCSKAACLVYDGDSSDPQSAWSECPYEPGPPPRVVEQSDYPPSAAFTAKIDPGTPNEEQVIITGPTKTREGDQPLPVKNDSQDIQSMVIADIEVRRQVGISRYGTALQAHNGRDALQDAYEEAMDLCMYLKQLIVERDT